jgi:hypothetical protein
MRQVHSLSLRDYLAYKGLRIWFLLNYYCYYHHQQQHHLHDHRENKYKPRRKPLEFKGPRYLHRKNHL